MNISNRPISSRHRHVPATTGAGEINPAEGRFGKLHSLVFQISVEI